MPAAVMSAKPRNRFCAVWRSVYSPSSSARYSSGKSMSSRRSSTSLATEPRSRVPSGLASTSRRRDRSWWRMAFGVVETFTSATSDRRTRSPVGVSSRRFSTSLTLWRASGTLQTWMS